MVKIGGHYSRDSGESILSCLIRNTKIGANAFQTFLGHHYKTTLKYKTPLTSVEIKETRNYLRIYKIHLAIHSILTLNFCSPPRGEEHHARYAWGIENVVYDVEMARKLVPRGVVQVVIHLGTTNSKYYQISEEECRQRYAANFADILQQLAKKGINMRGVELLIETNAGEGGKIGKTIENLRELWRHIPRKWRANVGFCVDTAHIFSAGYPIHTVEGVREFFEKWDKMIGIREIKLIHLNDSREPFAEHKDKHIHLGEGYIYFANKGGSIEALRELVQVANKAKIPLILETREEDRYGEEIKMIKKFATIKAPKIKKIKKITKKVKVAKRGGATKKKDRTIIEDKRPRIIEIFRELSNFHQSLSKKSGNTSSIFRAKSYTSIVKSLEKFDKPIYSVSNVAGIPGIGKSTLAKIQEIIDTGDLQMYRDIQLNPHYRALKDLQRLTGIGPESAEGFIEQGIESIDELRRRWLKGNIKLTHIQEISLKHFADLGKKIPRKEVTKWRYYLERLIRANIKPAVAIDIVIGGSYIMGKKQSSDLDVILLLNDRTGKIINYAEFEKDAKYATLFSKIIDILRREGVIVDEYWKGTNKWMGIVKMGKKGTARHLDLRWIPSKYKETYLLFFGSGEIFSRHIRAIAKEQGYKLTEWGLFDLQAKKYLAIYTEKEIFEKLGMKYVPPNKR